MNILFFTKSFGIGGVEIVTLTLAKVFKKQGHNVSIFVFYNTDNILRSQIPDGISLYIGYGYKESQANIDMLKGIIISNNIEVIINQWGLPFLPIRVINKAIKGLNVKVISVYHNQIDTNGKLKAAEQAILRCSNPILKPILYIKHSLIKIITSYSMKYVYNHSDIYEVLSPSFIELFKKFTGIKNPQKLVAQPNPITIEIPKKQLHINLLYKQQEIIYVGRLDFIQKKVHRIINTWNYLEKQYPDWRLTIVGDGSDRQNLELHVKSLGLKNVYFEGFQNPIEYYKRASVLMLTSDFEGFPLVIIECMSIGVIPVVYNSYAAVGDIIDDGKDGIIIPFHKDGYRADEAARMMTKIMDNNEKRYRMAMNAIEKSKKFSINNIYREWISILE